MRAPVHSRENHAAATLIPPGQWAGYPMEDGIFGVNAEITRKGFVGGLSAEMLNNRKLFAGTDAPAGWVCDGFERITDRREESLCGSSFVILRDGGSMSQTSPMIATARDKTYEARAWVRAITSTARVSFGLAGQQQSFTVAADGSAYTLLSFCFEGEEQGEGTFSLAVSGEAAVYELSLRPTDHFHGMRRDVIDCLRAIGPTAIRFPGGCAADHFDWKESLKSPELRIPTDGSSKGFLFRDSFDQDTLDIGLNEFILLCRELNAEPEYTVSLLLSDGEDARRLVEYCNGDRETEYGAKRQALGFDPFGIHLWYVGNEAYFFGGEFQNSRAAALRTSELTRAMKSADPSIAVAIGLTWGYGHRDWCFDFMKYLTTPFEYVSYHDYIGILPDATQGENGMATREILEDNFRGGDCFGLNFYRDQLFRESFDSVRVCVDEWNYSWGKDSSNALFFSNALQFHFLAKGKETYHIDRAEFFMPVGEGMITVKGTQCTVESTGHLFRLMAGHRGGQVQPWGSDNPELDILCTHHGDRYYLSAVNRKSTPITLTAKGYDIGSCTEIRTGEYSFTANDFEVAETDTPTVHGHSVLFCRLVPRKSQ